MGCNPGGCRESPDTTEGLSSQHVRGGHGPAETSEGGSLGETSILGEAAEALVFLNTKMSEAKFPASGGRGCLLLVFEKGVFIVQKARTDNVAWFPDHGGVANIAIKQRHTEISVFPVPKTAVSTRSSALLDVQ